MKTQDEKPTLQASKDHGEHRNGNTSFRGMVMKGMIGKEKKFRNDYKMLRLIEWEKTVIEQMLVSSTSLNKDSLLMFFFFLP